MGWDLAQYQNNVTAGLIPASSHLFADDAAFQTVDTAGNAVPNATGSVYSIPALPDYGIPIPPGDPRLSPLNVYVDVDKPSPGQSTTIQTDERGFLIPFCAPAGLHKVWVDFGNGRVMLTASDLGDQIDSVVTPGTYQLKSEKNAANGYPGLDSSGKITSSQVPDLSAVYQSKTAPNPWRYTLTVDDYGLVLKGLPSSISQIFQVQDPNGAPIFSVGHVGGPAAYGDNMTVYDGSFNVKARMGLDGTLTLAGGKVLAPADIDAVHNLGSRGAANGYATLDATGVVPAAQVPGGAYAGNLLRSAMKVSGRTETRSRLDSGVNVTITSGVLYLVPIYLTSGQVVSSISFVTGTTAAGTPTNQWFALFDNNRAMLARTADDTTNAWPTNTTKTLNIAQKASGAATSFTCTYTGLHYIGFVVAATTVCNILGGGTVNVAIGTVAPYIGGANTGMTAPPAFPFTAAIPTSGGPTAYAFIQ